MNISTLTRRIPFSIKRLVLSEPHLARAAYALMATRAYPYLDVLVMLSSNEGRCLTRLAEENNPQNSIVEIGCYAGGSAILLGKGAEVSGSHVYSIDPFSSDLEKQVLENDGGVYTSLFDKKPSKEQVQRNLDRHSIDRTVTLIEGFSQNVASRWLNGQIGLLFIDGNHDQAYDDYRAWEKHLVHGAIVAFHDTGYPENGKEKVTQDVERIARDDCLPIIANVDSITALRYARKTIN